jgi:hypothetical protein
MRTQSRDTSPEAERVLIDLIRKAPISKRFGLVQAWTKILTEMNLRNIRERYLTASEKEIALLFAEHNYGPTVANDLKAKLNETKTSYTPDLLVTITSLIDTFEQLGIAYYIGGSIASSTYGMRQAARDIDFVVDLQPEQIRPLVRQIEADYAVQEQVIYEAFQNHTFFSMIHLKTLLKVDVIISKVRPFDQQIFCRVRQYTLAEGSRPCYMASPEDMVLVKLALYRLNGEVADDQWNDILGILKVQGAALDLAYLQQWGVLLKIDDLLKQAYIDAGFEEEVNE